ncbi:MurR/RpiR family transcriptional regulator [Shinella sp.]|uniref:MurR/RpiR family transcriptional regulator n=1 Tax=Shinella sp. TaxID=1870904 RepID=UPI003F71D343
MPIDYCLDPHQPVKATPPLRDNIGTQPWLAGDRLKEFRDRSQNGDALARSLELEIAALLRIYEIANTKEWARAVKRLANTPQLFVAGFQTERGIAQYFANQLQYLRPGVQLADISGGNFSEILLNPPKSTCLVIFEARRYSRLNRLLVQEAKKVKIPITLITDAFCDWGRDLADEMFVVPTEFGMFWESTAQMASLGNLLINGIFNELGVTIEGRMNMVSELHGKITGYVSD